MTGPGIRCDRSVADVFEKALGHGVSAISTTSAYAYARRSGLVALTLQTFAGADDVLPGGFVAFESVRLVALGYRVVADGLGGLDGLGRRAPFAVYRPRIDLPGTGRISFRCSTVFDAAGRGRPGAGHAPPRRPAQPWARPHRRRPPRGCG